MPAPYYSAKRNLERILQDSSLEQKIAELRPRLPKTAPLPARHTSRKELQ